MHKEVSGGIYILLMLGIVYIMWFVAISPPMPVRVNMLVTYIVYREAIKTLLICHVEYVVL